MFTASCLFMTCTRYCNSQIHYCQTCNRFCSQMLYSSFLLLSMRWFSFLAHAHLAHCTPMSSLLLHTVSPLMFYRWISLPPVKFYLWRPKSWFPDAKFYRRQCFTSLILYLAFQDLEHLRCWSTWFSLQMTHGQATTTHCAMWSQLVLSSGRKGLCCISQTLGGWAFT